MNGCQSSTDKYVSATVQRAAIEAKTNLPDYPAQCREEIPKVVPKVGEKWRWVQYRNEVVREQHNAVIQWCAQWYDKRQAEARGIQSP